jgi:hypothetical protein
MQRRNELIIYIYFLCASATLRLKVIFDTSSKGDWENPPAGSCEDRYFIYITNENTPCSKPGDPIAIRGYLQSRRKVRIP